ncbi:MAG: hypothetical protein ACJA1R_001455, partial [Flavobacteriales bacterium]
MASALVFVRRRAELAKRRVDGVSFQSSLLEPRSNVLNRRLLPLLLLLLVTLPCCSDEPERVTESVSEPLMVMEPAPLARDMTPPEFTGVERVSLTAYEYYELSWLAATDDVSESSAIVYEVYHLVEPYEELTDDNSPILVTEPGATEAAFSNEAEAGRYYVRAIDEAGNRSAVTSGLAQRSRPPWVRTTTGTVVADIHACVDAGELGLLCAGEEGYAARWDDEQWHRIRTGTTATLRVAQTLGGSFLYSELGHLIEVTEEGPEQIDVRFDNGEPQLPFRQFTADNIGLRYWIDNIGQTFVGSDVEFHRMQTPLALPNNDCRALRGLAFSEAGSFAFCEDGATFSVPTGQAGRTWRSLTPRSDFPLRGGLHALFSEGDAVATLVDDIGIRRVSVGGWKPILLTEYPESTHPLDRQTDLPETDRIAAALRVDEDEFLLASDIGVIALEHDDDEWEWEVLSDTEGVAVGLQANRGDLVVIYADGSVAEIDRDRDWLVAPSLDGFIETSVDADGNLWALTAGSRPGVYRWQDEGWQREAATPRSSRSLAFAGIAVAGDDAIVFGAANGAGEVWSLDGRGWDYGDKLALVPPDEANPEDEPAPPSRIEGGDIEDILDREIDIEPFVHGDIDEDGRAVVIGEHQVWWRNRDDWVLLTVRPGALSAVTLDAGETYVLIEDGAAVRCWRDRCGGDVRPSTFAPNGVVDTWQNTAGLVAMLADRSIVALIPAVAPENSEDLLNPWSELTPGTWLELAPAVTATLTAPLSRRYVSDIEDILYLADGSVM